MAGNDETLVRASNARALWQHLWGGGYAQGAEESDGAW